MRRAIRVFLMRALSCCGTATSVKLGRRGGRMYAIVYKSDGFPICRQVPGISPDPVVTWNTEAAAKAFISSKGGEADFQPLQITDDAMDRLAEAIALARSLAGDDFHRQVQLPDHATHDHKLLIILLSEDRRDRLHAIQQLQDHRCHSVKEAGPKEALQLVGDRRRSHHISLGLRIQDALVWCKKQFDPLRFQHCAVALEGARIALEVLPVQELQAVYEDAHRYGAAMTARQPDQGKVAFVQVSHGGNEYHRPRSPYRRAQGGNVAQDAHQPRLKNSRRLFMLRTRDTSSSKSASRSTKLRFSELTSSTGAAQERQKNRA